eukprot:COSAG02_NODE_1289_length_13445_cov_16.898322_6_plen_84_part_00
MPSGAARVNILVSESKRYRQPHLSATAVMTARFSDRWTLGTRTGIDGPVSTNVCKPITCSRPLFRDSLAAVSLFLGVVRSNHF